MGITILRPRVNLLIPNTQVWTPRAVSASGGWWNNNGAIGGCVAAYAPKGAASLAASYTNLTGNATHNAAPGVAPTWDATGGWTFNGTTQHLTTGITPVNNLTWSAIVRFSDVSGTGGGLFGAVADAAGAAPNWLIQPRRTSTTVAYWIAALPKSVSPAMTTGILAIAGTTAYRNGNVESGPITSGAGTYTSIHIGRTGLHSGFYLNGKIQALAIYSTTLTDGEVATLTTLMNAL